MENLPPEGITIGPEKSQDDFDYQKVKDFVLSKYENQIQAHDFLNQEKARDEMTDEKMAALKFLVEYQDALTQILLYTTEKSRIELVWAALENRYRSNYGQKGKIAFRAIRDAVVSQVAAYKIFSEIDMNPIQPTTDEDIKLATDLKLSDGSLVQVKGRKRAGEAGLFDVTKALHEGISLNTGEIEAEMPRQLHKFANNFRRKVAKYTKTENLPKLFILAIPLDKVDHITGKPSDDLVDTVRYWFALHNQKLEESTDLENGKN